jgi:adenylate kinase
MHIALTGTPGTGKTTVSQLLREKNYTVIDVNAFAKENNCITGADIQRDTAIVDLQTLETALTTMYPPSEQIIFFEGHLTHLLASMDTIIILRCHPYELIKRLSTKKWSRQKVRENIEAEILDVILCEAVEIKPTDVLFEIDTTQKTSNEVAAAIEEIIGNSFKPMKKYNIGQLDWSEEILHMNL